MEKMEIPTVGKPKIDNVVQINSERREMIAAPMDRTSEKMIAQDTLALVTESLDDILQYVYENAPTGVRSVVYIVLEQVSLHVVRRDMIGETFEGHISTYFDFNDDAGKIFRELLSTANPFKEQVAASIKCRTGKSNCRRTRCH